MSVAITMAFVFALSIGTGVAVGIAELLDTSIHTRNLDATDALLIGAAELVVLLAGVLMARALFGVTWVATVGLARDSGRRIGNGWLALLPFALVMLGPSVGFAIADGKVIGAGVGVEEIVAFAALALLIGAAEELWFRGVLIETLGGVQRPWLAIAGSAVLFGLPHVSTNPAALLNAGAVTLAVGVPFAIVRLRCRSLVPLIGWHAIIDMWAFVQTADVVAHGSPSAAEFIAGLTLPALVALGYAIWFARTEPSTAT